MELTHRFRDCACPGTPHPQGDTVTYPAKLDFDTSARVVGAIFDGDGNPNSQKAFAVYLYHAPASWNLVDEEGKPKPLDRDAVDALPFEDQYEIANHADSLYSPQIIVPLLRRMSASSESGPTTATPPRRSPR